MTPPPSSACVISDRREWEELVGNSIQSTVFHTWAWKEYLERQGYESQYVLVRDGGGEILGGCPFFATKYYGLLRVLRSIPRSALGGPLLTPSASEEGFVSTLLAFLRRMPWWRRVVATTIKLTDGRLSEALRVDGSRCSSESGFIVLDLEKSPPSDIWDRVFTRDHGQRNKVRRLEQEGFETKVASQRREALELGRLHTMNLRRLRQSPRSPEFYGELWDSLHSEYFHVMNLAVNGSTVASQGFFTFEPTRTVHISYFGFDKALVGNRSVALYLDWRLIEWAWQKGYRYVNFGTTPADPTDAYYHYKSQFGGDFIPRFQMWIALRPRLAYFLERLALKPLA